MRKFHQYYVYLLASQINGTLYIGIKKGFTKKYGVNRLVYFEVFQNVNEAIQREKQLKKWNRAWKIELIEKGNVLWNDLAKDWYDDLLID